MTNKRTITTACVALLSTLSTCLVLAEDTEIKPVPFPAAQPSLLSILPAGLQQGTSVEAVIDGRSMSSPSQVIISGTGVNARLLPAEKGRRVTASSVPIQITADADAEPGIRELRIVTPGGVSNVLRLVVGMLPEVTEQEPNNEDTVSERITVIPVVINGSLPRSEDVDCFRFHAKQGEQLVFDLSAEQLHPYISGLRPGWMEGVLTVRDVTELSPLADALIAARRELDEATTAVQRAGNNSKTAREAVQSATKALQTANAHLQEKSKALQKAGDDQKAKAETQVKAAQSEVESATKTLEAAQKRATEVYAKADAANKAVAAARTAATDAEKAVKGFPARPSRNLGVASHFPGREDPAMTFTAPHDGDYVIEVRDELFRGRTEFNYRLTIVRLSEPATIDVADASTKPGTIIPTAYRPVGTSAVKAEGRRDEAEPNNSTEQAMLLEIPALITGVIEQSGDADYYRFSATKGQRLVLETVGQAIGSPVDTRLDLFDARGRKLKSNDDNSLFQDAAFEHRFDADGEYVLCVMDTTGIGSPGHLYQLNIREPAPDFSLTVYPDNPRITAGGSVALTVMIDRRDGFREDVEVRLNDLPAGAVASSGVITNGQNQVTLSLTVPADCTPAVSSFSVVGKTVSTEAALEHSATPVERSRYINEWRYVPVQDLSLSILPAAPYTMSWKLSEATLKAGENFTAALALHRTPGFDAAVRVTLDGLPSRVVAPVVTFEKGQSEVNVELRVASNAPSSQGNAVASGTASSFIQNSPALALTVEEAPKSEKKK
ncbi:MAG: hypothetical protein R3C59_08795 [Planctomycetaceae bacterium]